MGIFKNNKMIKIWKHSAQTNTSDPTTSSNNFLEELKVDDVDHFKNLFTRYNEKLSLYLHGSFALQCVEHPTSCNKYGNQIKKTDTKAIFQTSSKRKNRVASRPSLVSLKQLSPKAEEVFSFDTTAEDPHTLLYLKSVFDSREVPTNWDRRQCKIMTLCNFSALFVLPSFLLSTGVSAIRNHDSYDINNTSYSGRNRIRPKNSRIQLNYDVLRDVFFKYQFKSENKIILNRQGKKMSELEEKTNSICDTSPVFPWSPCCRNDELFLKSTSINSNLISSIVFDSTDNMQ